ncbi:hypothetical protein P175DRAFT_0516243 [Aspergillus ochraceoroseus IBT 24754]|uniref:AB hydrolase-1 domain-containing protein n=3 Tax=Aspergillus subgen. Nidulantes TaxID=2720870 RepID=A0A0F8VT81_9EURO|nr:uncharacterized protein P175DRAFT_0516243 [Aspergillus ochraceoroseus IBT 24754]KKK14704.1 hypothetical protein AOCH_006790 [Aspergillus ochraceoroseus]KKK26441.1 hypothetical protein ARAM_004160 [Aspergillus rambellii]PTU20557.1 hypothetical protein P175DRAFT_0516243 [Aspergillus ochraceoroseus IBT 24754]
MVALVLGVLKYAFVFSYGLFTLTRYGVAAVLSGYFFKKTTEKDTLDLQLARNRLWDLSKKWLAFSHQMLTLQNGFKFHYVCNEPNAIPSAQKPLVIFIHGFPDSWAIWRHILNVESLQDAATVVAVDLPGYGGSEGLSRYSATQVLENLTEFIIAVRAKYGIDGTNGTRQQRTIIVGHDWGCLISMRLAADAPQLADRFILTNGPLIPLVVSNGRYRLSSSLKMFKTFLHSPIQSRSLFSNALRSLKPVFQQIWLSGYIFAFLLPSAFVEYLGAGGNYSFLKLIHIMSYGKQEFTPTDAAECMASTIGPSAHECKTKTVDDEEYPKSLAYKRVLSNFLEMTSYYRDNTAVSRWRKSVETITSLHSIRQGNEDCRVGSGAGLFDDGPTGGLKASTTVLWGKADTALNPQLCLDGISEYLVKDSHVVELPNSGHFTPLERESRIAITKTVEWAAKGEREDIGAIIQACYPSATVTVRK